MVIYFSICFIKLEMMMFEWKKVHLFGFDKNISSCYDYRACLKPWRWVRRHTFTAWSNKPGKGELKLIFMMYIISINDKAIQPRKMLLMFWSIKTLWLNSSYIKSLHFLLAVSQILSQIIKNINQIGSLECNENCLEPCRWPFPVYSTIKNLLSLQCLSK